MKNRTLLLVIICLMTICGIDKLIAGELTNVKGGSDLYPVYVLEKNKCGYINASGKLIINPGFEEAYVFHEGLAAVKFEKKYGYINTKGEVIIKPTFEGAGIFSEGLAGVKLNDKCGFINLEGKKKIDFKYKNVMAFSEGKALVIVNDKSDVSSNLYIDKQGKIVLKPKTQYVNCQKFSQGLAAVGSQNNKYGYIDIKGNEKIPLHYDAALSFSEGLGLVKENGKYGFIDINNNYVIKPKYEIALPFSDGLAVVKKANEKGYIDRTGKIVIKPKYDYAGNFNNGLAEVRYKEKGTAFSAYINKDGKIVWKGKGIRTNLWDWY